MTIFERQRVRAAFARAMQLLPDRDAVIDATAQALSVPREVVAEAVSDEEGTA